MNDRLVEFKNIINASPILPTSIKFDRLLVDLNNSKILSDEKESDELIETVMGAKMFIFGGAKDVLTEKEIRSFLDKGPELATIAFDVLKTKKALFADDYKYYDFLLTRLQRIYALTKFNYDDNQVIFDIKSLLVAAERFVKVEENENLRFTQYEKSLVAVFKKLYPTQNVGSIDYKTIRDLLDDVQTVLEQFVFLSAAYDQNKAALLNEKQVITQDLPVTISSEMGHVRAKNIAPFKNLFNRLAKNYKYFANEDGYTYYGKEIRRYKSGFVMTGFYNWASKKMINGYGRLNPKETSGQKYINNIDLKDFFYDAESIIRAMKFWPRNILTFPGNTVLLTDFFQHQADGTLDLNSEELTEYLNLAFGASKMTNTLYEELGKHCDLQKKELVKPDETVMIAGYDKSCVIEHFTELFFEKNNFKIYAPELAKYMKEAQRTVRGNRTEDQVFTDNIIGFARSNPEGYPLEKADIVLLVGSYLNVEITFLRFDKNVDGFMANEEMENSFNVYRNGIITVAMLTPKQIVYTKSIYYYLMKNQRLPSMSTFGGIADFLRFHALANKDKIIAKRINLSAVLYYLAEEARKTATTPSTFANLK